MSGSDFVPPRPSRRDFLGRYGAMAGAAALGASGLGSGITAAAAGLGTDDNLLQSWDIPPEWRIYSWIKDIFAQGIRRPGYPADIWAEEYVATKFRRLGLENVRFEPIEVDRWEPHNWSLEVSREGAATVEIDCFPVPFAPPCDGLELELAGYNPVTPSLVAGKASLYDETLLRIPGNLLLLAGSAPPNPIGRVYDPDLTLPLLHTLPFGPDFLSVLEPSANAGAKAFVGSLLGYPGDSHDYFVPYWGGQGPIPGVWISGSAGTWLKAQQLLGKVTVRMTVESTNEKFTSNNVVGELPGGPGGNDEEMVIIGSHHDAPWPSAVEDGSGMALVFAQASYWSSLPARRRPHKMVFLLHGGHMSDGAGLHGYIEAHKAEMDKVVLELHLEHAAREYMEAPLGGVMPTGQPVHRWWFTSRLARLESAVYDALVAEDVRRSMILAPDAFGTQPPTDGGYYHNEGVPIVNFLTAPFYLFDRMDTVDKVDRKGLVPLTRAGIRILQSTTGVTAAQMRAG